MGKNKVKRELIIDESTRRTTYRKRKIGLLKKLKELTILCGVSACAIIFNSFNSETEAWPSRIEANKIFEKLKKLPEKKQNKFKMDHKAFLEDSIDKAKKQLKKQKKKNINLVLTSCIEDDALNAEMFHGFANNDVADELLEDCLRFIASKLENGGSDDSESNDSDHIDIVSDNDSDN